VFGPALMVGQRLQGADSKGGVERQGHPGGQQRVAAEQGHEPGRASRHDCPLRVAGVEDPEHAEVLDALAQHGGEVAVRRPQLRAAAPPVPEVAGGRGVLDRLAARMAQRQCPAIDRWDGLDAGTPFPPRRNRHLPAQPAGDRLSLLGGTHEHPVLVSAAPPDDVQMRVPGAGAHVVHEAEDGQLAE
jgi:hypothetical protein